MYIERGSLVVDWFCIDHCSRQNGCSPPAEVHVGGGGGGGGDLVKSQKPCIYILRLLYRIRLKSGPHENQARETTLQISVIGFI